MSAQREEMEEQLELDDSAAEEQAEQARMEQREKMHSLAGRLEVKLNRAIEYKSPVEARMLVDEAQYWGRSYIPSAKDDVTAGNNNSSRQMPVDNKTRSKTRIASARIGDMLFPTNAPNWDMRPTPYPEIPQEAIQQEIQQRQAQQAAAQPQPQPGQPPEAQPPQQPPEQYDPRVIAEELAERSCRKMVKRIRDALAESQYPKHGRAVIDDACRLGTGVLKGPYNLGTVRRRYRRSVALDESGQQVRVDVLEQDVVPVPAVSRCSVWNFFPLPARNIDECEGTFELHLPTATKLRQMVQTHEFDAEYTVELLNKGPNRGSVDSLLSQRSSMTGENTISYDSNYALWEYHGPINKDDLAAWGVDISMEEELDALYGEVWFCQGCVLRIALGMLEADSSLPYQVFNYEKDETSIFGFGIPFIMRDDQRVIDTMWDAMLYNAAVSAGPQILITKGLITPADGSYNVNGPKTWYKNEEDISAKDAMECWTIPSTINNNMPLYERAKANADENTNLPLMLGDSMAAGVQIPASGLAMMLNQQNIVQRQAAHSWDDDVTGNLIPRLYDWYMQHDPDESIKGDYEIEVRGASYLMIKDAQAQHAQLLIQMAAQDPQLASMLNIDALYRVYLGFMDVPVDMLMKSPEQVQREKAAAGPDPMQQLQMDEMQAKIQKYQAEAARAGAQAQGAQQGGMTQKDVMMLELEYAKLGAQREAQMVQLQIEQVRQQTQMARAAADEQLSYEKIRADMEKFHAKQSAELGLSQRQQASEEFFRAAELRLAEYRDRLKMINVERGFDTFG